MSCLVESCTWVLIFQKACGSTHSWHDGLSPFAMVKSPRFVIVLLIALLLALYFSRTPFLVTKDGFTNVTGSKIQKALLFGVVPVYSSFKESPLMEWCQTHNVPVHEKTIFWSVQGYGVLGHNYGDGGLPDIMRVGYQVQAIYLTQETEATIRQFVTKMEEADHATQKTIVETAFARAKVTAIPRITPP